MYNTYAPFLDDPYRIRGTETHHTYHVVAEGPDWKLALRVREATSAGADGGEHFVRVRVVPRDQAALTRLRAIFTDPAWKRPETGNVRFSQHIPASHVREVCAAAVEALGPGFVTPYTPSWLVKKIEPQAVASPLAVNLTAKTPADNPPVDPEPDGEPYDGLESAAEDDDGDDDDEDEDGE